VEIKDSLKGNLFIKADTIGNLKQETEGAEKVKTTTKKEIKETLKGNIFIRADTSGDLKQETEESKKKKEKKLNILLKKK